MDESLVRFSDVQDQLAFALLVKLVDAMVNRLKITRQQALNSTLLVLVWYAHRSEQELTEEPLKAITEETIKLFQTESWHRLM